MNPVVENILCCGIGLIAGAVIFLPMGGKIDEDRFRERCITATATVREIPHSDNSIALEGCNKIADKIWGPY